MSLLSTCVCVHVCLGACVHACVWHSCVHTLVHVSPCLVWKSGQFGRVASLLSPMWILGLELRSSDLVASALTYWVILQRIWDTNLLYLNVSVLFIAFADSRSLCSHQLSGADWDIGEDTTGLPARSLGVTDGEFLCCSFDLRSLIIKYSCHFWSGIVCQEI